MWSLGSADVSLVRAIGYGPTLAEIKAADSMMELNDVYTNEGALVKLSDGSFKIAYKVAKFGRGPLEVCFGAAPGSRPSKDFKASAAVLNAAVNGKRGVIVEMCLGFSGGVFTTPAGAVRVSAPTPTGPRDDSVGEITVQALQEDWAPVGSPQRKDLQEFLDEVTSLAVTAAAGAGSAHTFSMAEGDSDADDDESDGEIPAEVVRRRRRKAVGNISKNAKVAKYPQAGGILSSLVPKDGSLTAMQTAAIMFGEARVRDMVAFEALPAVIPSEQQPALEMRAERALVRMVAELGSDWRPAKQPKSAAQLRLVAEELYTLATERVRGSLVRCGLGTSAARPTGGSSGMGSLADLLNDSRGEQAPMDLELAQAAVPASVAESLAGHRLAIETSVTAAPGDPAAAMAGIMDSMVRDDLARMMSSNGGVHAPGEREAHKRSLLPHCHTLRESLLLRVLAKLIARGGKAGKAASGARMVPRDMAWPLAEAAMAGNFNWEAYVKMSRLIEGPAAAAAGTAREVAETFAVVRVAWAAVIDVCYPTTSDALEELVSDLTRTAVQQASNLSGTLLLKHYDMLLSYVQQLLSAFADMVTAFRKGGTIKPSVGAVVALHSADWTLLCQMSSIPKHEQQQGGGNGAGGKPDGGGRKGRARGSRGRNRRVAHKALRTCGEEECSSANGGSDGESDCESGERSECESKSESSCESSGGLKSEIGESDGGISGVSDGEYEQYGDSDEELVGQ